MRAIGAAQKSPEYPAPAWSRVDAGSAGSVRGARRHDRRRPLPRRFASGARRHHERGRACRRRPPAEGQDRGVGSKPNQLEWSRPKDDVCRPRRNGEKRRRVVIADRGRGRRTWGKDAWLAAASLTLMSRPVKSRESGPTYRAPGPAFLNKIHRGVNRCLRAIAAEASLWFTGGQHGEGSNGSGQNGPRRCSR
jgi:hypothetical protein